MDKLGAMYTPQALFNSVGEVPDHVRIFIIRVHLNVTRLSTL